MKKNKMMRLASSLLVAVLLTSSVISGTFAKYVVSGEGTDTAKVAKWGVTVEVGGQNLFQMTDGTTVVSTVNDIVAPGTKNDGGITFGVAGTPEVAGTVTFDFTDVVDVFLKAGLYADTTTANTTDAFEFTGENYYPVEFTLTNGSGVPVTGTLADIATYLEGLTLKFAPNENLATKFGTYQLTWAWAFNDVTANNQKDTLLGNLIVNPNMDAAATDTGSGYTFDKIPTTDFSTTVSFKVKVTVAQED